MTRKVVDKMEQKTLKWFGHMERMDESRLVKKIMHANVWGERPRGRPRLGWAEGVKTALGVRGLSIEEGRIKARNRAEWRVIVSG